MSGKSFCHFVLSNVYYLEKISFVYKYRLIMLIWDLPNMDDTIITQ